MTSTEWFVRSHFGTSLPNSRSWAVLIRQDIRKGCATGCNNILFSTIFFTIEKLYYGSLKFSTSKRKLSPGVATNAFEHAA
uniref:Uncharacterized protein n=1 Tax=Parascaris equorum TaxID=6256 RepID=A0A914R1R4_PAREQ